MAAPGDRYIAAGATVPASAATQAWPTRWTSQPGQAHAAARTKQEGRTRLAKRYRQLVARRGKPRAAVAVGHQILVTAYYLLRRQQDYNEVTPAALDERRRIQARLRAVQQLRQLGFEVTLTPSEAAA